MEGDQGCQKRINWRWESCIICRLQPILPFSVVQTAHKHFVPCEPADDCPSLSWWLVTEGGWRVTRVGVSMEGDQGDVRQMSGSLRLIYPASYFESWLCHFLQPFPTLTAATGEHTDSKYLNQLSIKIVESTFCRKEKHCVTALGNSVVEINN